VVLSENKCSLLFWSLIESPGDLMKDDDDSVWPYDCHFRYCNCFIVCI